MNEQKIFISIIIIFIILRIYQYVKITAKQCAKSIFYKRNLFGFFLEILIYIFFICSYFVKELQHPFVIFPWIFSVILQTFALEEVEKEQDEAQKSNFISYKKIRKLLILLLIFFVVIALRSYF